MPANANKPERWKADISRSEVFYNNWFLDFGPKIFREARRQIAAQVSEAFEDSAALSRLAPQFLKQNPQRLTILRAVTAPLIPRERISGLASVHQGFINNMEATGTFPLRMPAEDILALASKLLGAISKLLDRDILPWLQEERSPAGQELEIAVTIVADRLVRTTADITIKKAHEQDQLDAIRTYLEGRGYVYSRLKPGEPLHQMQPGTFALSEDILIGVYRKVNFPMDAIVQPHHAGPDNLPILIELKISGDYANTYGRRKYEARKMHDLTRTYGKGIPYVLFLNGYFDDAFLRFAAAQGIDWVWEHRIDDLSDIGI